MASHNTLSGQYSTIQEGKMRLSKDLLLSYLPHGHAAIDSLLLPDLSVLPLTTLFGSIKLTFETLPQSHIIPFWVARTHNHLCAATNLKFSPISVARRNDLFSSFSKPNAACLLIVLQINQGWLALKRLFNVQAILFELSSWALHHFLLSLKKKVIKADVLKDSSAVRTIKPGAPLFWPLSHSIQVSDHKHGNSNIPAWRLLPFISFYLYSWSPGRFGWKASMVHLHCRTDERPPQPDDHEGVK